MPQLPLTIIILTNRADERFVAALESAQVATEVLVVDNETQNNWSDLEQNFHFTLVRWEGVISDFSAVRNQALQAATHNWVLFLDSDEVLFTASVPELAQIITENTAAGVVVRRSDIFHGKKLQYGEAGNQAVIRLGQKTTLRFVGKVHEVAEVQGSTQFSHIEILHYSHPSTSEFISKVTRYAHQVAETRELTWGKLLFQLLIFPPAKFLYDLFILGGFQDGWQGVTYAACMSLHSLLVRIYLYEKQYLSSNQQT